MCQYILRFKVMCYCELLVTTYWLLFCNFYFCSGFSLQLFNWTVSSSYLVAQFNSSCSLLPSFHFLMAFSLLGDFLLPQDCCGTIRISFKFCSLMFENLDLCCLITSAFGTFSCNFVSGSGTDASRALVSSTASLYVAYFSLLSVATLMSCST